MKLVEQTDPDTILFDRSMEATVQSHDSFVSNDGHIVLVGDAAHAMNPADGQSASFAFEDAVTLALLFKQEKTRIDNSEENDDDSFDLDSALRTYSQQRIDRCIEMQRRSEERAAKAMKGDNQAENVSKWIYDWEPPISDSMECNE